MKKDKIILLKIIFEPTLLISNFIVLTCINVSYFFFQKVESILKCPLKIPYQEQFLQALSLHFSRQIFYPTRNSPLKLPHYLVINIRYQIWIHANHSDQSGYAIPTVSIYHELQYNFEIIFSETNSLFHHPIGTSLTVKCSMPNLFLK